LLSSCGDVLRRLPRHRGWLISFTIRAGVVAEQEARYLKAPAETRGA
jgi:hypothetical protein